MQQLVNQVSYHSEIIMQICRVPCYLHGAVMRMGVKSEVDSQGANTWLEMV